MLGVGASMKTSATRLGIAISLLTLACGSESPPAPAPRTQALPVLISTDIATGLLDTHGAFGAASDGDRVVLALGTEFRVAEAGVEFALGGASLSRDAEITKTNRGALIELDVNGKTVTLEFEQLDDARAQLRWTSGDREMTAEMSRGGEG
jgi:hypothetical protein